MGKKYSYLLEIVIGISVILLINVLWFRANMGFIGVSPHPLWIVVLFIAVRYGSLQGFLAGLLSAFALLISVSYNISVEQQFEFSAIPGKQFQLAGLFIFFGFLFGEERSRVNRLLDRWKYKFNKLRDEFEALSMEHLALKNINTELEGRILGQADTVNSVYEAARELVTLKVEQLYPAIIRLVSKLLKPDKCSLFIWEKGDYVLKGSSGYDNSANGPGQLKSKSDIIKKAINERRIVTVLDMFKAEHLRWEEKQDPCMVAPLFFGDNAEVPMGFIVIDEISFLKFNPDAVRFLTSLSEWASKSLDNALSSSTLRMVDVYDKDLKVFKYEYAVRRLKEELLNVKVSDRSSCVLLIQIKDLNQMNEEMQKKALKAMAFVISHTLRSGDTVAQYTEKDTFLAILPGTDLTGADIAIKRILEQVKAFAFKPFEQSDKTLDVSISSRLLEPQHETEADVFGERQKTLKH